MWCACHLVEFELGRGGFSTPLWPAILPAHINTWWSHWSWGRGLWNQSFKLTESKHYGERKKKERKPKTLFLDSWNHNRLMFIPSHMKRKKESTYSTCIFLLTSRQWEELSGNDSLMKSSRVLGWLVWGGVGGVGETMEETPSAPCLICSFWRRRSFLRSLAFRHGGRLASAPTPAPQRKDRLVRWGATKNTILDLFSCKRHGTAFSKHSQVRTWKKKRQLGVISQLLLFWCGWQVFAFMLPLE